MENEYEALYTKAIELFLASGHTATTAPLYVNHSLRNVVYLDSDKSVYVEKGYLNCANYISHLFDIENSFTDDEYDTSISFYSAVLTCNLRNRSQYAHDIHAILHASFSADYSIVIFQHESKFILSVAGFSNDIILSDWYDLFYDYDQMVDRLNIGQLSLHSAYGYIADIIYLTARKYYLEPSLDGAAVYSILPERYFVRDITDESEDRGVPLKEILVNFAKSAQEEYGDDYVETSRAPVHNLSAIDDELARLSFELDTEDDIVDILDDENEDEEIEQDEYEFEDVDPEIFEDAELMLKWLEDQ